MYRIETTRSRVKKELKRIPKADLDRIAQATFTLRNEPRPSESVQLQRDVYRIRIGHYRIIYKVYDEKN